MLATPESQVIPEQKTDSEKYRAKYKNAKSKIRFCNFSCFDFAFEFFTFSKKQQSKNSQKENELYGFSCPKPEKNNARTLRYSACKSIYILQKVFCSITFLFAQDPARIFYRSSFQSLAISLLLGNRLAAACYWFLAVVSAIPLSLIGAQHRHQRVILRGISRCLLGVYLVFITIWRYCQPFRPIHRKRLEH